MTSGDWATVQPDPTPNNTPSVQSLVYADLARLTHRPETANVLRAREQIGIDTYGTALQVGNGRDMLRDAIDEAADLVVYLRGAIAQDTDLTIGHRLSPHYLAAIGLLDGLVAEAVR